MGFRLDEGNTEAMPVVATHRFEAPEFAPPLRRVRDWRKVKTDAWREASRERWRPFERGWEGREAPAVERTRAPPGNTSRDMPNGPDT